MPSESFLKKIMGRDLQIMENDADMGPEYGDHADEPEIIADFTEYSPFHIGHRHCMMEAKRRVPEGIFVAVIPGPLERNGRGLPYIMTREARAAIAIRAGADIAVEGPPMGVMVQVSITVPCGCSGPDADGYPELPAYPGFERSEEVNWAQVVPSPKSWT